MKKSIPGMASPQDEADLAHSFSFRVPIPAFTQLRHSSSPLNLPCQLAVTPALMIAEKEISY